MRITNRFEHLLNQMTIPSALETQMNFVTKRLTGEKSDCLKIGTVCVYHLFNFALHNVIFITHPRNSCVGAPKCPSIFSCMRKFPCAVTHGRSRLDCKCMVRLFVSSV